MPRPSAPSAPTLSSAEVNAAVRTYLDRIERDLKAGHATEHTHRAALSALLEALLPGSVATNEPRRGRYGAPDYLIQRDENGTALTLGYAEAKDVGVSLGDTEKTGQLQRYRAALPNLLLTDYLEFRWYVGGEKRDASATLGTWDGKKLTRGKDGPAQLSALLDGFAAQTPLEVGTAKELAARMARLTALIRSVTLDVLLAGDASDTLKDLLESFRKTILPGLTHEDFADMYAQTLAYGLFAARVQHARTPGAVPFNRQDAARNIPKTNPLLQKLFYTLTGPELDDEPYVTLVDDLAGLLAHAAIDRILAEFGTQVREEDPIVHFYETFLAQYNPRLREQRGVYYTPTPVVDYIVRSVDALLKRDFGLADGLGDTQKTTVTTSDDQGRRNQISAPRLLITDPATGTGTFPYQIIRLLRQRYQAGDNAGQWPAFVRDHLIHALYGFELMMAPYAIAHLKLSMCLNGEDIGASAQHSTAQHSTAQHSTAQHSTAQHSTAHIETSLQAVNLKRLNIYLTNTLEDPQHEIQPLPGQFRAISDEAQAAGKIKADYPIMVVLGNPPYSGHSANKNDWIDDLLKGTVRISGEISKHLKAEERQRRAGNYYQVDGEDIRDKGGLKWLQDDYVKFIRWAQWRVEQTGAGIVAFITPHGYLDNPTFRGMRQSLTRTFDDIYVLDLHGNTNKKEKTPDGSKDENVFDIKQGVAIGLFIRKEGKDGLREGRVHRADLWGSRDSKYAWLLQQDVITTKWQSLNLESPKYIFTYLESNKDYLHFPSLEEIMPGEGGVAPGILSTHDDFAIHFTNEDLQKTMGLFANTKDEADARNIFKLCSQNQWTYHKAVKHIKEQNWREDIHLLMYRPFDHRVTVFNPNIAVHLRKRVSDHMRHQNISIVTNKSVEGNNDWNHVFTSELPVAHHSISIKEINYQLPLYLYNTLLSPDNFPPDAKGRTPNLSKKFITALSESVGLTFAPAGEMNGHPDLYTPEDVFHYIYAVLHSPGYRARYADFLRTDFPRIPLPDSAQRFRALAGLGAELAGLHLLKTAPKLGGFPRAGDNEVAKGYPKYTPPAEGEGAGKVQINPQQWFTGVPPQVWTFRVGGYQVAEKWLKDRRGRVLSFEDVQHYQQTLGALAGTLGLMARVDEAAGGLWG